jgi:hypothetical protein
VATGEVLDVPGPGGRRSLAFAGWTFAGSTHYHWLWDKDDPVPRTSTRFTLGDGDGDELLVRPGRDDRLLPTADCWWPRLVGILVWAHGQRRRFKGSTPR